MNGSRSRRPKVLGPAVQWSVTDVVPATLPRVTASFSLGHIGAALQVADRVHLLQNLRDVLTQVFTAQAPNLAQLTAQRAAAPKLLHDPAGGAGAPARSAILIAPHPASTAAAPLAPQRRTPRWAPHQKGGTSHLGGVL